MSEYVVYMAFESGSASRPPELLYLRGDRALDRVMWRGEAPVWWGSNTKHPIKTVQVCEHRRWHAIGDVRLDNRTEIAATTHASLQSTDLALAVRFIDTIGTGRVRDLLGDYAFVMWDSAARELIAVRDALGVKALFYTQTVNGISLASRASLLADDNEWDMEYVAEFLLHMRGPSTHTVYRGISCLAAGSLLHINHGRTHQSQYWNASQYAVDETSSEADLTARFRTLLTDAVKLRADGPGVWAQLSGGLDSSSIVCTAQQLSQQGALPHGLAGSVTVVDEIGFRDELKFVDAVLQRYRIPNRQFADWWAWRDWGAEPPITDQPDLGYCHFGLEDEVCDFITGAGGNVVLSGIGADHYLKGPLVYLADLVAAGHTFRAVRETALWAVASRRSFWRMGYRHVVVPLMPKAIGARLVRHRMRIPSWVSESFARDLDMKSRVKVARRQTAARGEYAISRIRYALDVVPHQLSRGVSQERIEFRYPFLYRPLVELGLSLRPELRSKPQQPSQQKWILRSAMRGVLPELVRTRTAKATVGAHYLWSLSQESKRIDLMLRDPILAQMGCIEPSALRKAVDDARTGRTARSLEVFGVLTLEAWLRVRSGQWVASEHTAGQLAKVGT